MKKKPKKLVLESRRRNVARDFSDRFLMPDFAMESLLDAADELAALHAEIDPMEVDDLADGAKHIETRYELGEFVGSIMKIERANMQAFDAMMIAVGVLADNIHADIAMPVLMHMAATFQVPEMFVENAGIQAEIIAAFGKVPNRFRDMQRARAAENKCWADFADIVCRSVGGKTHPTLDELLLNMEAEGAAEAIGQIAVSGADINRAKIEIQLQSHRMMLRGVAKMPLGEKWAERFRKNLRETFRDFEMMRSRGMFEMEETFGRYRDLAEQIADVCKAPRPATKVIDFKDYVAKKIQGAGR
ncbi:MAG: hypothetical protein LBL46_04320 [Rickettsiales bacterium]|jgi:hypothetical protein|nr:hypothetical protein [Rickettsiales bacterium]